MRWFIFLGMFISSLAVAQKPEDYIVLYRQEKRMEDPGGPIRLIGFWVLDPHNQREFFVNYASRGDQVVGSDVREYTQQMLGEMGSPGELLPVSPRESEAVLAAVEQDFNRSWSEKTRETVKELPFEKSERGSAKSYHQPTMDLKPKPLLSQEELPFLPRPASEPTIQAYDRERYAANFSYQFGQQMQKSQFAMRQQLEQQQALRGLEINRRDMVRKHLQQSLSRASEDGLNEQSRLLQILFAYGQPLHVGGAADAPLEQKTVALAIDKAGIDRRLYQLADIRAKHDWLAMAEVVSTLNNPWSGITGEASALEFSDKQGVLRGPLIAVDSLPIKALASRDRALAYELLKAANALQAYASEHLYVFKSPQNAAAAEGAVLLLRAAALSGEAQDVRVALGMASYFTGQGATDQLTVIEKNGVYQFAPGQNLREVLGSNAGETKLAKAIYNQLGKNLGWVSGFGATAVVRPWGKVIPFDQAMLKFLDGMVRNPEGWLADARQQYSLPNFGTALTEDSARAVLRQLPTQGTSIYPFGPDAVFASHRALVGADQLLAAGDVFAGEAWLRNAQMFADICLGFVPVVGEALDLYKVVTGKNLITGEDVSTEGRILAAVGVLVGGFGDDLIRWFDKIEKMEAEPAYKVLNKAVHSFQRVPTDELNEIFLKTKNYTQKAWEPGKAAWRFRLPESSEGVFVRFYSEQGRRNGSWLVEKRLVAGKSSQEIAELLRLPKAPEFVADVLVPAQTEIIKGPLNNSAFQSAPDFLNAAKPTRVPQYFVEDLERLELINEKRIY